MAEKEILKAYEFYVKNFPYIKYSIEKTLINKTDNILLIIFYDVPLYKKYLEMKNDNDFKVLLGGKFFDNEIYNNEDEGVYIIYGDICETIDLVINNVFGKNRKLDQKELKNIGIDNEMKNSHNFYVSLIKIIFCDSKGEMVFKFNEIKKQFTEDE